MVDEKKTYLINIESNLNKYAEEATQAKEKVEKLTEANNELINSGKASKAEIEASNAALRDAKKEYNNAKKMVDLQTAANNAETGSRKQLESQLKLEMFALGKLGNAYIIDAKGRKILNPVYVEQRKKIADIKQAIIDYDLALKDGRSNIGRYGESVSEAMKGVGVGMISILAPAALLEKAMEKVKEAFFDTEMGAKAQKKWTEGIKTFFANLIKGNNLTAMSSALASAEIAGKMAEARVEDRKELVEIAKLETEIDMLALSAADATKSETEQKAILIKLQEKENELIEFKRADLQEDLDHINEMLATRQGDSNALLEEQAQITAELVRLEGDRSLRVEKRLSGLRQKELDRLEKEKKATEELNAKMDEANQKKRKQREEEGVAEFERLEQKEKERLDLEKRDIEAGFEYQKLKNQNNLDALSTLLDQEYAALLASVEYTQMTNNEKLLADQQYTEAKKELAYQRIDMQQLEFDAAANLAGSLSDLFGKQTIASKVLSVAQATIGTYTAGVKAMAELPLGSGPFLRFATLASVIATGMAQVKNILAVKVPGSSGGGAPTSIVSAPPAQRIMANQVGSTVLNQPQLTQTQLNALPQQGQLTVDQLVEAFKKLPAPVTTIEDINARTKSTNKIASRANI